jgi:hypothetical protein
MSLFDWPDSNLEQNESDMSSVRVLVWSSSQYATQKNLKTSQQLFLENPFQALGIVFIQCGDINVIDFWDENWLLKWTQKKILVTTVVETLVVDSLAWTKKT